MTAREAATDFVALSRSQIEGLGEPEYWSPPEPYYVAATWTNATHTFTLSFYAFSTPTFRGALYGPIEGPKHWEDESGCLAFYDIRQMLPGNPGFIRLSEFAVKP